MPKHKNTHPCRKSLYRVKNWPEYDQALVKRGSVTFWISDDIEKTWCYAGKKQRGSQYDYSKQAIILMLTIKNVFHLPNRATEGLVKSIFAMLHMLLCVPDHTTLSRRGKDLNVKLPRMASGDLDIVMDSTGLKIFGEGEWKVRTHGKSKRRTWRKLHLGVDPQTGEIQAAALPLNRVSEDEIVKPLLEQVKQPIHRFVADGSYDKRKVYDYLHCHIPETEVLIPPRKNAHIWQHANTKAERLVRDENLRSIRKQGRKSWKQTSGYPVRSLAETAR